MRVAFYTLGCKVNQYETAAMTEQFIKDGFEIVNPEEESDIYVLNSCTVTAGSDRKNRQILRRFRKQNPASVIAVCGCFPQAFPNIADEIPEADVVVGASNKKDVLSLVRERLAGGKKIISIKEYASNEAFEQTAVETYGDKTRAFVKIQDGCERFCAYCIIPHARGPVRSKSLADLGDELVKLVENGYKEVVLVGINLSCYGVDFGKHLLDAIRVACSIEGIERVRLGSLEPELLGAEAIAKMSKEKKLCPQFHLSLQSGSDSVLKRMRRHYDTKEYRTIVSNLRGAFPNCAITTDLMVGFPGESEEEFLESLNFAKEIGFARVHVFAYSKREGTTAYQMEGQISNKVKLERSRKMIATTNQTRKEFLAQQVGRVEQVLFEGKIGDNREGYTKNYTSVVVESVENLHRKIIDVEITGYDENVCYGVIVEARE